MHESAYRINVIGPDNTPYNIDTNDRELAKEWLFKTIMDRMANNYNLQMTIRWFFANEIKGTEQ